MRKPLERRVTRLERNSTLALPRHLPIEEWSDEQLMAVIAPGGTEITDEKLAQIAKGGTG
jgi:hypothetical protein